ncbi:hypothetical protein ACHWQZ_G017647 [Mnemiopsis leidyi]
MTMKIFLVTLSLVALFAVAAADTEEQAKEEFELADEAEDSLEEGDELVEVVKRFADKKKSKKNRMRRW